MKKLGILLLAAGFLFGSGFFKKNEDGSVSTDTESLTKKANEVTAQAGAEADKIAKQAGELSSKAIAKIKKAAAKYDIKPEEIMADLDKSLADIKQKVSAMEPAQVVAYVEEYSSVFKEYSGKVTELTEQMKGLGWKEKLGATGKELKEQLKANEKVMSGLQQQCGVYLDKLKAIGVDPAAFGVDLSAYGL